MYQEDTTNLRTYFNDLDLSQFESRFCNLDYIGFGSGSSVYSANQFNNQEEVVALKCYNKKQLSLANIGDIIRQICFLSFAKENNLFQFVKFQGAYHVRQKSSITYFIVLEYCHISLTNKIKNTSLTYVQKLVYFLEICEKLSVMHSYNIIHRDLKPDNILFTMRQGKQVLVLSDFGHAKQLRKGIENTSLRGTLKYTHPEFIDDSNYGMEWDIYSLSVILFELVKGEFFFDLDQISKHQEFIDRMKTEQLIQQIEISDLRKRIKEIIIGSFQRKIRLNEIIAIIKEEISEIKIEDQLKMKQIHKPTEEKMFVFNKKKHYEESNTKTEMNSEYIELQLNTDDFKGISTQASPAVVNNKQKQKNNDSILSQILNTSLNDYGQDWLIEGLGSPKIDHITSDDTSNELKSSKCNSSEKNIGEKMLKKPNSLNYNNLTQNFNVSQEVRVGTSTIQKYGSFKESKIGSQKKRQSQKKPNSSIQFSRSNSFGFLTNLAKLYINEDEKLARLESSVIELGKMEKFQTFLMKIKEIQSMDLQMKVKKRVCLLAIIYLISKVKNYQKDFEEKNHSANKKEVRDNIQQFLDKIIKLKQPVFTEFKNKDINNLSNDSKKIYQLQDPRSEEIINEFKNELQRNNYQSQWAKIKNYFVLD